MTQEKEKINYTKVFYYSECDETKDDSSLLIKPDELELTNPVVGKVLNVGTTFRSSIVVTREHKKYAVNISPPPLQTIGVKTFDKGKKGVLALISESEEDKELADFLKKAETHLKEEYCNMWKKFGYLKELKSDDSSLDKITIIKQKPGYQSQSISLQIESIDEKYLTKNKKKDDDNKDEKKSKIKILSKFYDKSKQDLVENGNEKQKASAQYSIDDLELQPFIFDGIICLKSIFRGDTTGVSLQISIKEGYITLTERKTSSMLKHRKSRHIEPVKEESVEDRLKELNIEEKKPEEKKESKEEKKKKKEKGVKGVKSILKKEKEKEKVEEKVDENDEERDSSIEE